MPYPISFIYGIDGDLRKILSAFHCCIDFQTRHQKTKGIQAEVAIWSILARQASQSSLIGCSAGLFEWI